MRYPFGLGLAERDRAVTSTMARGLRTSPSALPHSRLVGDPGVRCVDRAVQLEGTGTAAAAKVAVLPC